MINVTRELQATLLLHMFYHVPGQGSGDESTHGTLEMHDFFPAGQSVGILTRTIRQKKLSLIGGITRT